jgi:hypothetical protein
MNSDELINMNYLKAYYRVTTTMDSDSLPLLDKYWLNDELAQPTPVAHAFVGVALIIITVLSIGGNAVVLIVYAAYVCVFIYLKTSFAGVRDSNIQPAFTFNYWPSLICSRPSRLTG